jgi:hypothetical protein
MTGQDCILFIFALESCKPTTHMLGLSTGGISPAVATHGPQDGPGALRGPAQGQSWKLNWSILCSLSVDLSTAF